MLETLRKEALRMLNKDQNQDVGAGGMAIQAGGNVVVGVSAAEARQIALDMAKLTFFELTGIARDTMNARVEEITDKVISQIEKIYPEGLQKAVDPDFQYALLTVQKHYGRTGDEDLGGLLVDILVDRSKLEQRDILQIVLSESLEVAPKLTRSQIANLSLIFLLRYTQNYQNVNHKKLGEYFDQFIQPIVQDLVRNKASFQHLEFTGCGNAQLAHIDLSGVFLATYPALFSIGLDAEVIEQEQLSPELNRVFIMRCLNDYSKFQATPLNDSVLDEMFAQHSVGGDDREKLTRIFSSGRMSSEAVLDKCVEIRPYMRDVFAVWNDSDMKGFMLTSVGMAIGHANIKRIVEDEFADLSIWIN